MRGKVTQSVEVLTNTGITPAYAGKSCPALRPCAEHGDHPRVCGEKLNKAIKLKHAGGSPPRMRGKVLAAGLDDLVDGITPAYAGKRQTENLAER